MGNRERRGRWSWAGCFTLTSVDIVSAAIYLGVLVAHIPEADTPQRWWCAPLSVALVLGLFVVDRGEALRFPQATPARAAFALLVARIALMGVVVQLGASALAWFLFLIPSFRACLYFGSRPSYIVAGITWAGFWLVHWMNQPDPMQSESQDLILFAMALVFVCTVARALREERESRARGEKLLTALTQSHAQLQAYAAQAAEFATTEERNRLARDIHDSLGHYLTVTNVQIANAIAFQYRDPAVAEQSMRHAKDMAHDALRAVRQSVGALRTTPDAFVFTTAMTALVERIRTAGCTTTLQITGEETAIGQETLTAVYYVAQEGLTNVQKHAGATAVAIDIRFGDDGVGLTLRDNGCGFHHASPDGADRGLSGGYGLQSMRGRLERVGGRLGIASSPGAGTTLTAIAPSVIPRAVAPPYLTRVEG